MSICNDLDLVYPYLFVGNSRAARTPDILKTNGITAVVNVARDLDDPPVDGILTFKFGLTDGHSDNNKAIILVSAFDTIYNLIQQSNETVLVHCHEGVSRSPAAAILYIARIIAGYTRADGTNHTFNSPLEDAYKILQEKRPIAFINKGLHPLVREAWSKIWSY